MGTAHNSVRRLKFKNTSYIRIGPLSEFYTIRSTGEMAPTNDAGQQEKLGAAMKVESTLPNKNDGGKKQTKGKGGKKDPEELSEEDKALKEGLELAVARLQEVDTAMHKQALDHLVREIRSATSSMTSVPKPLKFLRPHYDTLKGIYNSWAPTHEMKKTCADMMSVLAMTMAEKGKFECLKYKLAGTQVNIASWGHEYVRHLSGEISEEYNKRLIEEAELVSAYYVMNLCMHVIDTI